MPFVLLVVFAFALGLVFSKEPSRGLYAVILVAAAVATWYFMR